MTDTIQLTEIKDYSKDDSYLGLNPQPGGVLEIWTNSRQGSNRECFAQVDVLEFIKLLKDRKII